MTLDQLNLLLTVARILRARIKDPSPTYDADDTEALNDALRPFDPYKTETRNDEFAVPATREP